MKNLLLGLILLPVLLFDQKPTYEVTGVLKFKGKGELFICIVTEEEFSGVGECSKGIQYVPTRADIDKGYIVFRFKELKKGVYGIRAFQDKNGNGELDMGMFGPKEPWGMSWNGTKRGIKPKFQEMSFELKADKKNLIVEMQ
jgi:uncharacterized protein (DUF2141 family)